MCTKYDYNYMFIITAKYIDQIIIDKKYILLLLIYRYIIRLGTYIIHFIQLIFLIIFSIFIAESRY